MLRRQGNDRLLTMSDDATARHVLVVDDDLDSAEMLTEALAALGYEASYELSGAGALESVARQRTDVVVLDIGLPGMDGFQVIQRLRALPNGRALRIVVLSGFDRPPQGAETATADFDEYLVKPVAIEQLTRLF